jgi:hypothetical protein
LGSNCPRACACMAASAACEGHMHTCATQHAPCLRFTPRSRASSRASSFRDCSFSSVLLLAAALAGCHLCLGAARPGCQLVTVLGGAYCPRRLIEHEQAGWRRAHGIFIPIDGTAVETCSLSQPWTSSGAR